MAASPLKLSSFGQAATTLSGGEAQRVMRAVLPKKAALKKAASKKTAPAD